MHHVLPLLRAGVVLAMLGCSGLRAGPPAANEVPVAADDWPETRAKTFDFVWNTVNEAYFDPTFGGVDWKAVGEKYRGLLPQAADNAALRQLLQRMLAELRRTHFAILPREAAVFTPAERVRIGTAGVDVAYIEKAIVVLAVKTSEKALPPDLHPGDTILAVERMELEPLRGYLEKAGIEPAKSGYFLTQLVEERLRAAVGTKLHLRVRGTGGEERIAEVTIHAHEGEWSEPVGDFPSVPVDCTFQAGTDGLVYLHFNVFARQAMKGIRAALGAVPAGGGLVIDLRGNPGGISLMAAGISGWLSDHSYLLATMHMRQGHMGYVVAPQEHAFLGPVAVLIDSGSASTSELMAAGLQEAGRARIFGETSAGAALPSIFKALPTGDLFQYAIADLQTPRGLLIEGRGVVPDEAIQRTRADVLAGRDPVLEAARRWLEANRIPPATPSPAEGSRP